MKNSSYEIYMAWYTGFCVGAGVKPIPQDLEQHEDEEMCVAFRLGFDEGRLVRVNAAAKAQLHYGVKPGFLRALSAT